MNDELLAKEMLSSLSEELERDDAGTRKKRPSYAPLFDNIASWLLTGVLFLLPFFVIPVGAVTIDLAKKALLVVGVALAFLFWLGARLEDGTFVIPKSPILLGGGLVALFAVISSLTSGMVRVSFWGVGTEAGTAGTLIIFVLLLLLSSIYFQSKKRLMFAVKAFMLSFAILAVVEVLRLFPTIQGGFPWVMFGHGTNLFGLLPNASDNLLGKWNDLGTFFAFGVLLCMACIEFLETHTPRALPYLGGVLGLLVMFLVNFNVAWAVLGFAALALLIYRLSVRHMFGAKFAPALLIAFVVYLVVLAYLVPWLLAHTYSAYLITLLIVVLGGAVMYFAQKLGIIGSPTLYVILIASLCFFLYTPIGTYLGSNQITSLEVRPSWGSTVEVIGKTLASNALLGTGPNTFSRNWQQHKPTGVNDTVFWSTDFNAGVGYIPTFVATTGILGTLAWLFFLLAYGYYGLRALFKLSLDHLTHGVLLTTFVSSLFLWVMTIVYVPDIVILSLAFATTGIFIGSLVTTKFSGDYTLAFFASPRFSFASVLGIVLLMLLSVAYLFFTVKNYVALAEFQSALVQTNVQGNLVAAAASLESAAALANIDIFSRSLADLRVLEMSRIVNTTGASTQDLQTQFQASLRKAIEAGTRAVELNPANYQNHVSLGRVYESLVPFKTAGAYDRALAEYNEALKLNPHNPEIYLIMARLELANGSKVKAREYIGKALTEKSNYAAAIFLLSQIEADAGNLDAAIKNAEQAAVFAPQDIGVYFQLGFLKYLKRDYRGAIQALGTAVQINPAYANAKYFLGLSLGKLGRSADALVQFRDIAKSNPDNADVARIISNLEAGRDALSNVSNTTPEKGSTPPVRQ